MNRSKWLWACVKFLNSEDSLCRSYRVRGDKMQQFYAKTSRDIPGWQDMSDLEVKVELGYMWDHYQSVMDDIQKLIDTEVPKCGGLLQSLQD